MIFFFGGGDAKKSGRGMMTKDVVELLGNYSGQENMEMENQFNKS